MPRPKMKNNFSFFLLAIGIFSATAFLPRTQKRNTRYFTTEAVLPAIPVVPSPSNATAACGLPPAYMRGYGFPIPVVYTNSPQAISNWLSDNVPSSEEPCILGFDVESVPPVPWLRHVQFEGPATVQLATPESCLVIHLLRKTGRPSVASVPILEAVLADENIIKAGVGIDHDMMELYQQWGRLEAKSRLNLGTIGGGDDIKGLKRLSKAILEVNLPKTKSLAVSNWSKCPLSAQQLAYSARDAWAGAAIVKELMVRDPHAFAPHRLKELLRQEQSIAEMNAIAMERKLARSELTTLLAPFRSKRTKMRELPGKVRMKASRLRCTIKESAPLKPMVFDVSGLGIEIEQPLLCK